MSAENQPQTEVTETFYEIDEALIVLCSHPTHEEARRAVIMAGGD